MNISIGDGAMAHSIRTIHDMFDALQQRFGPFPLFQDVSASVLDAEKASEVQLDILPKIARAAVA